MDMVQASSFTVCNIPSTNDASADFAPILSVAVLVLLPLMADPLLPLGILVGTSVVLSADENRVEPFLVILDSPVISCAPGSEAVRLIGALGSLPVRTAANIEPPVFITEATAFVVTPLFSDLLVPVQIFPGSEELIARGVRGRDDPSDRGVVEVLLSEDEVIERNDSWREALVAVDPEASTEL